MGHILKKETYVSFSLWIRISFHLLYVENSVDRFSAIFRTVMLSYRRINYDF